MLQALTVISFTRGSSSSLSPVRTQHSESEVAGPVGSDGTLASISPIHPQWLMTTGDIYALTRVAAPRIKHVRFRCAVGLEGVNNSAQFLSETGVCCNETTEVVTTGVCSSRVVTEMPGVVPAILV